MQTKRYSMMSEHELRIEIAQLNDKAKKAEQLGMVNEFAVLERKIHMAKAYLLDPNQFIKGEVYEIEGDPGVKFHIHYMNGIFAWGIRDNGQNTEEGIPISLLKKQEA
ncbi:YfhH family protein [Niallia taxi]|uniref:YfhH family protein n=1 Tax=Niallia taxi TaxID=2499688 RepID=UPI003D2BCC40